MVAYVQNKLIKVVIIVDFSIIGLNAHCMRPTRYQSAVYSHFALETRCAFATSLQRFSQSGLKCFFYFFMGELCLVYVWLGQTSVNANTTNLERVLYLCLTLDWRWADVLLGSTFTRGKTLTFLSIQKRCAEVDAHKKCMTFIRRSSQIINEFWRTPSESQRTDQNSSFFVRWTSVMVCVTGSIPANTRRWPSAGLQYCSFVTYVLRQVATRHDIIMARHGLNRNLGEPMARPVATSCSDLPRRPVWPDKSRHFVHTFRTNKLHLFATCRDGRYGRTTSGNLYIIWLRFVNILPAMVRQAYTIMFTYIRDMSGLPQYVVPMSCHS